MRLEEELAHARSKAGVNGSALKTLALKDRFDVGGWPVPPSEHAKEVSAYGAEWLQHPGSGAEAALDVCLRACVSMEMDLGANPDLSADEQARVDSMLEQAQQCALTAVSRFAESGIRGSKSEVLRALERQEAVLARAVEVHRAASSAFKKMDALTRSGGVARAESVYQDVSSDLLPILADAIGHLLQIKASIAWDLEAASNRLAAAQERLLYLGGHIRHGGGARVYRALPRSPALSRDERRLLNRVEAASRSARRGVQRVGVASGNGKTSGDTAEADLSPMLKKSSVMAALTGRSEQTSTSSTEGRHSPPVGPRIMSPGRGALSLGVAVGGLTSWSPVGMLFKRATSRDKNTPRISQS